jgi:hypothetical protein
LINILKSTTKNVKKRKKEKKSTQNFFILKYIIKSLKISNFYYLKVLALLNFSWRYESSKSLIFTSKIRVKTWNISIEKVIPTAKNRIIPDTYSWINFEHLRDISISIFFNRSQTQSQFSTILGWAETLANIKIFFENSMSVFHAFFHVWEL